MTQRRHSSIEHPGTDCESQRNSSFSEANACPQLGDEELEDEVINAGIFITPTSEEREDYFHQDHSQEREEQWSDVEQRGARSQQSGNDFSEGGDPGESTGSPLDPDHPMSDHWPEVFSNGREQFSENFYLLFPWAREVDPFYEDTEQVSDEWYLEKRNPRCLPLDEDAEVPPVIAFIRSLTSLELDDLPRGDDKCLICGDVYRAGELAETPLMLPCNHVFGKECLEIWFSGIASLEDMVEHDSCPMCRRQYIFEKRETIDTTEGLAQLLRDANYLLTAAGPLRLTPERRAQWEEVETYVNDHIEEERRLRQELE